MSRRAIVSVLTVAVAFGGVALISTACGDDGTGPGDINPCQSLHISADGRSLWGDCCKSSTGLVGAGVLSASTTCSDDEGCSASRSVTVTRAREAVPDPGPHRSRQIQCS